MSLGRSDRSAQRPLLLDLFCGAGGAAMGYHRAGFDVIGVDIKPQPRYPFEFVQADAMTYPLDGHDAIHASPPCQAYSVLRRANPGADYPELIAPTRERLIAAGVPWVIENVPGAPLAYSVELCGSTFGLGAISGDGIRMERTYRQLRRHRLFETSFPIMQSPCQHRGEAIGVYGGGPVGRYTFNNGAKRDPYGRRGGYQGTAVEGREAMGINWMNRAEITQAIPPAYTEHIGHYLLAELANLERQTAVSVASSRGRSET
jgi:DNA (cytosine-5)-methyltransferase 1